MRSRYAVSGARYAGLLVLAVACRPAAQQPSRPSAYDPAHDLGTLFHDVQMSGMFPDSKTFADARPIMDPKEIAQHFDGTNLNEFVRTHFEVPKPVGEGFRTDPSQTME